MTARTRTRPPADDQDRGSATLYFTLILAGLLMLAGLVVDGGAKARALGRADQLAAEAARVAAQQVDLPSLLRGTPPVVDRARARAAALDYLAAGGAVGTVTIRDGGRRVTVDVTLVRRTLVLAAIGISEVTAHGTATATLTTGAIGNNP